MGGVAPSVETILKYVHAQSLLIFKKLDKFSITFGWYNTLWQNLRESGILKTVGYRIVASGTACTNKEVLSFENESGRG